MRFALVFVAWVAWTQRALATEAVYATAGQSSSIQKRETSARAASLGGNGASLDSGADSVLTNPAALAQVRTLELGAHHQSWLAGINQESLTAAGPAFWGGAWGLGLGLVDYGVIDAVNEFGQPLGSVGAQDYSLSVGWARKVSAGFAVGAQARGAREVLASEGLIQGSVDLGMHWMQDRWQAGLLFADVASTLLGGNRGPSAVRAEISGDLMTHPGDLRVSTGFSAEPNGLSRAQVGLEAGLAKILVLRAGYEARIGSTLLQGLNSTTFGLGFAVGSIVLDYAFLPFGDIGAGHRLSLKWQLGTKQIAPVKAAPMPVTKPLPVIAPTVAVPVAAPPVFSLETSDQEFKIAEDVLAQARQAEDQGFWDRSLAMHRALLEKYPRNPIIWRSLGDLYYRAKHQKEAVDAYDHALAEGLLNKEMELWLEKYRSQP